MSEPRAAPVRPTPERMAKGDVVETMEARGERPKPWYTFESVHDGLLAAGLISKQAWERADAFKRAWTIAHGSGCAAGQLDTRIDGSRSEMSEAQRRANQDLNTWSKRLAPDIYRCIRAVVGVGEAPTTWAAEAKWHPAAARQFICTSLEQLALTDGAKR